MAVQLFLVVPIWSSASGEGSIAVSPTELDGMSGPEVLEMIATELSDSLPLRIDDGTWLTSIEIEDGGLVYGYASDATAEETRDLARARRSMIEAESCRNPLHGTLLLKGRVIRYVYAVDGVVAAEIAVSLESCEMIPVGSDRAVDA
jgi:hypothetical protein